MEFDFQKIKIIAFDADDTLWINETFFRDAEEQFCQLVSDFAPREDAMKLMVAKEASNMALYGYGIKPFTLSLIEAAIEVSQGQVTTETIGELISIAKTMLQKPVQLLPGIEQVLKQLHRKYRLVMVTKGDLLDQERKLMKSGLEHYFHHIEIVSNKTPSHYLKVVQHLEVSPEQFLMVGNSIKSDILPVLEIGASAFHIPFHTTWVHEVAEAPSDHAQFQSFEQVTDIVRVLIGQDSSVTSSQKMF